MAKTAEHGTSLRRIMVAVDGSEPSLRAMGLGARLAKGFGSELLAVYVAVPEVPLGGDPGPGALRVLLDAAEARGRWALERAQAVARAEGIDAATRLEAAPAKEALLEVISDYGPDLVVVGSRGHSALKRLLLGSISEALVYHAKCSVLVVR